MSDSVYGIISLVFRVLFIIHLIQAQTVSPISNNDIELFQFGNDADDLVGPRFDDSSSDPLTLTTSFTFFGRQYNHIIVNSNGVISFGIEGFRNFYAVPFPFMSPPLIAPFWDDFNPSAGGAIYYRQTNDSNQLELFYNYTLLLKDEELNEYYPTHLFIATWHQVPPFGIPYFLFEEGEEQLNTFQAVLATNGTVTFAVFLYQDIEWGRAQIGFNAGDGYSSFMLDEVLTDETVNELSNVEKPGVFVFRIDNLSLVECYETVECSNSTSTLMTAADCCLRRMSGLAYIKPGSEKCHTCIVFGWLQDSYSGEEQELPHEVMTGFQKGAHCQQAQHDLAFTIQEGIGRFGGDSPDLMVLTSEVRFIRGNPQPSAVNVSFLIDGIAQEHNETVTLVLVPLPTTTLPTGEAVFFLNTTDMIIIDTDVLNIYFSQEEFRTSEVDGEMIISVCKDKQTPWYHFITVIVSSATVENATFSERLSIPDSHPDSPNRASLQDFDNREHFLRFYESGNICLHCHINITNDDINEASEEIFIFQLTLAHSLNPNLITLSRNASIGIIEDDDPIRIGFEMPMYNFTEPPILSSKSFHIPLIKEDGRISEQTFTIQINVSNITTPYQPATLNEDFEHEMFEIRIYPDQQSVPWEFELIPNEDPEKNEAFSVILSSVGYPKYLTDSQDVYNKTTIVINDPQSLVGFIQDIYTVREDESSISLSLFLFNSSIDVEVNFTTVGETAIEGKDYEEVSKLISIAGSHNQTNVSISIPITNDDLAEGLETIGGRLKIISPPDNSSEYTITIEIIDDEDIGVCGNIVPHLKSSCSTDAFCKVSANGRHLLNCSCKVGYLGTGLICRNINECDTGQHNCDVNANCSDTPGSFECLCKEGFFGNGIICIDNKNKLPDYNCDQSSGNCTCFSTNGSIEECGCSIGYELSDNFCQDVNECNGTHGNPCHNGTCENTNGSHKCFCPPGYIFDSSRTICVDLNECSLGIHDCDMNAVCSNHDGGYSCSCKGNYFGDGRTCFHKDDCNDECTQKCITTSNSSFCGCEPGYYLSSDLKTCKDVDECDSKSKISNCDENADCTNTDGSYECLCKAGYQGNGILCIDIDECDTGFHNCDKLNADCNNTEGSFLCTCKEFYFGDGKNCEAGFSPTIQAANSTSLVRPNHQFFYTIGRNFCLEGNDTLPPQGTTINCTLEKTPEPPPNFNMTMSRLLNFSDNGVKIPTEYSETNTISISASQLSLLFEEGTTALEIMCYVSNLFGSDSMKTIIKVCDASECQHGVTNNCTHDCTRNSSQTDGTSSYECSCNLGYALSENDMGTCDDIDECNDTFYSHNCSKSEHEMCNNTLGSFTCTCMQGFRISNESKCEDIDECLDNALNNCGSFGHKRCNNTQGGFDCVCKEGFNLDELSGSCEDIDECKSLNNCTKEKNQECHDTIGSYRCECLSGFTLENTKADNSCIDVDECDESLRLHNCSHDCKNINGSYECSCHKGYFLDRMDNLTCHDVNECEGTHNCHPNAKCINNEGSFTCQCKPGYDGDGITSCHLSASLTIGSTLGSLSFVLVVGIVGAIACICCFVRCYSKANRKKRFYLARLSDKENEYGKFTTGQRQFSVQSSFKLNFSPHLIIKAANIKLIETIGQGEFGVVYKGHIVKDLGRTVTEVVAIKTLKGFYDRSTIREMLKECSKMHEFEHKHVVTLRGVCLDGGPAPYIIMPFMANGSLLAYLKKNRETLIVSSKEQDEMDSVCKQLADMCVQVAEGMEYLASMKMVHRDLAARNCMIDINFIIKVADFGLSESVGTKEYFRQNKDSCIKLPLKWLAPESIEDGVFSEKSDVWAFGITCWEIFSVGKNPYPGVNPIDLPKLLADGQRLEKPINDACHDEMYKFMHQCWELEPENRPTFSSLVKSFSKFLESIAGYMDFSAVGVEHGGLKLDTNPVIIINEMVIDED